METKLINEVQFYTNWYHLNEWVVKWMSERVRKSRWRNNHMWAPMTNSVLHGYEPTLMQPGSQAYVRCHNKRALSVQAFGYLDQILFDLFDKDCPLEIYTTGTPESRWAVRLMHDSTSETIFVNIILMTCSLWKNVCWYFYRISFPGNKIQTDNIQSIQNH